MQRLLSIILFCCPLLLAAQLPDSLCKREKGYSARSYRKYAQLKTIDRKDYAIVDGVYYYAHGNDQPTRKMTGKVHVGLDDIHVIRKGQRTGSYSYYDSCKTKIKNANFRYEKKRIVHREFDTTGRQTKKTIHYLYTRRPRRYKIISWDESGKRTVKKETPTGRMY